MGEPSFAETPGEPITWEPQPGITVTMRFLGELVSEGWSQVLGISNNDVVVGQAMAPSPELSAAFYWTGDGGMQMISATGWMLTAAYDINDENGVVVGGGYFNNEPIAFRWDGTTMEPLYPNAEAGFAEVAYYDNTAFGSRGANPGQAVRWESNSSTPLPDFGTGINTRDANDFGDVVGAVVGPKAFLWRNYPSHCSPESQIELKPLDNPVTTAGQAEGVNRNTQVVGYMWSADQDRAFIWDPVKKTVELDGLGDGYSTRALDVNDDEFIVGQSQPVDGREHAVVWMNRRPVDLHPLDTDIRSSTAQAVNNNGLIAGTVWTSSGARAVVWTIEGELGPGEDEPLTPEEQLALLKDEIADLAAAGVVNGFRAWSMTRKVNVALRSIEAGWTRWAIVQLRLLVWQVNSLVGRGTLTPVQAEPLLELAEGAIDGLRGD